MLNVEDVVKQSLPRIHSKPWLAKPTTWFLRNLLHENDIRDFSQHYPELNGIDFVEQVLDYFNFSYAYRSSELDNIPSRGRVIIFANHPIGSLDGLALLKLVSEVRSDVKIVANDLLMKLKPLQSMLLPVRVFNGSSGRDDIRNMHQHLNDEGAVIVFPAGEVSRLRPQGVRDTRWQQGFVKLAKRCEAPLLPIRLYAHNSALFYTASMVYKPLATLLLVKEMFRQQRKHVSCRIGELIPYQALETMRLLPVKQQLKLLKKHLYRLGSQKELILPTQTAVARPEPRQTLKQAIEQCEQLGTTACGKQIVLYEFNGSSPILREIGR
ncbi:MAG: GNAT family N-acetyltransferase, partial [Idiomarinaceae bacterium]|nr:GNAT family N-acetyltransferase [Idiomarinaceae bacterium]